MKTQTPKHKSTNGERGFTLIETTIASLVMLVGALGCASLFVFSLQNNVGGSERALAMAVIQRLTEASWLTFLGPRGHDVIGADDFQHARTREARDDAHRGQRERDRR